ncbi:unnamed protein product [Closterium sp. Yama58-4]|nr:unnamed protein product [Closterium sp. Yama58-4]
MLLFSADDAQKEGFAFVQVMRRLGVDPNTRSQVYNFPVGADEHAGAGQGKGGVLFDETCSHKQDFTPHGAATHQMMRLEDVFGTNDAFALNRSHLFVRNGCAHFSGTALKYNAGHAMHELPTGVFNWAVHAGNYFYHFLVKPVPIFLAAAPLMTSTLHHLPLLARDVQSVPSSHEHACT